MAKPRPDASFDVSDLDDAEPAPDQPTVRIELTTALASGPVTVPPTAATNATQKPRSRAKRRK